MEEKTKSNTLITFYMIFILFGLSMVTIDPLIPVIAEQIDVSYDKIGIALFIGSIGALISNFIAGRLSDRIDIKKLIIFGIILLMMGFTLFGIYLNFIIFIIVILFLRSGFGIIDTSVHSFSAKLFKRDISRIFIKLDVAWYFGAVIGPIIISAALYFEFLPKYLFFILAFLYMFSLIIFYRTCPGKSIVNKSRKAGLIKTGIHWTDLSMIKNRAVILTGMILFFYIGAFSGLSSWMTTYFLGFGVRVAYGSAILSLYWLFSIAGMVITTKIVSKFKEIHILFYGCLAGTICLLVFSSVLNIYIKISALALQAVFLAGIFSLSTSIAAKRDPKNSGTILGFTIASAFAGSVVFQPINGYVTEYFGKQYIALVASTGAVMGLILVSVLFWLIRNEKYTES
jgi:fucose permease